MRGILVDCPTHGIVEDKHGIGISGSNVVVVGNVVSCPICGRMSKTVDGEYSVDAETNEMTANLWPTPSQLRRLLNAAEWANEELQREGVDPDRVEQKLRKTVEREAPGLSRLVDHVLSSKGGVVAAYVTVLLAILTLLMSGQPGELSEDSVRSIVEQVYEQERYFDAPSEPTQPAPTDRPEPPQSEGLHVRQVPPESGTGLGSLPKE